MAKSVAELCVALELDCGTLADRCGLEVDRVMAILMGRWTPSPRERQAVADVLGHSPQQISWGHKTPVQHIYGHGPG